MLDRLSAVAAKQLDAAAERRRHREPPRVDPELDQFMVRPSVLLTHYIARTAGDGACDVVLINLIYGSFNLLINLMCVRAGGLLQHAGQVPGGAGAADLGGHRVLQERRDTARFHHR